MMVELYERPTLPDIIPKDALSIESPVSEFEYKDLVWFCSINKAIPYNFIMETYIGSGNLQSAVSFFNGLFCCCCAPNQTFVLAENKSVVSNESNSEKEKLTPKSVISVEHQFKIPQHTIIATLANCFRAILNPPQIVVSYNDPGKENPNTPDEIGTQEIRKPMMDGYDKKVVSKTKFTNSYQLHMFTYIAYLGNFISRSDFISNCSIGYRNHYDFYCKIRDYHQEHLNKQFM
jgi:hypothetical protein